MATIGNRVKIISGARRTVVSNAPASAGLSLGGGASGFHASETSTLHPRIDKWRIAKDSIVSFKYRPPQERDWLDGPPTLVNPTTIRESVDPQYAMRPVLGLSHEVAQYIRTSSRTISMTLYISVHLFKQIGLFSDDNQIDSLVWRNFWQSMCVPYGLGLAPPLVKVIAPNLHLNFVGIVTSLGIDYQRFDATGAPIVYQIALTFVETPLLGLMRTNKVGTYGLGSSAADRQIGGLGNLLVNQGQ